MSKKKIETIIREKISPYTLNERGKSDLSQIIRKYPYDLLLECIDIGITKYFRFDENGIVTQESVQTFLSKLGGIAFNKSRSPIEQEIYHLKNKGKARFTYWNNDIADKLLHDYVAALSCCWSNDSILEDLRGESSRMMNSSRNWSEWSSQLERWIDDVKGWSIKDDITIEQLGTILPDSIFLSLPSNVQSLCKQINASYENNLYDCTAVIMRRLLESLLVLSYQKLGIEPDIMDKSGMHHISLDKIIKNAEQNATLSLSSNTRKDMALFKELGNYSAHKIWYNCTQGDIKPHILKYRAIIEELFFKAGLKI